MSETPIIDHAGTAEQLRLQQSRDPGTPWKLWGPYLSERQWGTVREDYSENGDAWGYFSHDQARSRAYHWGEDGVAGFSDDKQRLCFALAVVLPDGSPLALAEIGPPQLPGGCGVPARLKSRLFHRPAAIDGWRLGHRLLFP